VGGELVAVGCSSGGWWRQTAANRGGQLAMEEREGTMGL